MNRRSYLAVIGLTTGGCLTKADQPSARPFGEKQHRDNIAMAAEDVTTTTCIEIEGTTIEPTNSDRFGLVRFWAQNLVDGQRQLPLTTETTLTIGDKEYTMARPEGIEEWNRLYEGGNVGPGVIRHGFVPFEVDGDHSERTVQFTIPSTAGNFKADVLWELTSSRA